jgi:hypothetical protein
MARHASLKNPEMIIQILEEDGGVIVDDFSSVDDVYKVNADAAPYLKAIIEEVSLTFTKERLSKDTSVNLNPFHKIPLVVLVCLVAAR